MFETYPHPETIAEKIVRMMGERYNDRSAWDKGVARYALELLKEYATNYGGNSIPTETDLLNGARNWTQYSEGGCALVYDCDIAERLCTPSELKKTRGGERNPNSLETWLDVQARALNQAARRITACAAAIMRERG